MEKSEYELLNGVVEKIAAAAYVAAMDSKVPDTICIELNQREAGLLIDAMEALKRERAADATFAHGL